MTVRVSNCGQDSHGDIHGDTAGDQYGNEWTIYDWSDYGQNVVFRHPNPVVRQMIGEFAEYAAMNDNIGYDQWERTTFWYRLAESNYNPANITTPCEADCSSGVAAIVKAIGILLGDDRLASVSIQMTTYNEVEVLTNAGFEPLYGDEYTRSPDLLAVGDILCNTFKHTNIVIESDYIPEETDPDIMYMQQILNVHLGKRDWTPVITNGIYDWRTEVPLIKLVQEWMCCCKDPTVMIDANFSQGFINALKLHPIVRGMENIATFVVKAALIGKGYKGGALDVTDWRFSPELERIVCKFQESIKHPTDGIVDSDTLFALTH